MINENNNLVKIHHGTIVAPDFEAIHFDFYQSLSNLNGEEVAILVHGFTGHKNWGFLPFLAKKIAENAIHSVTFNFSYDGISLTKDWFDDPDKFSQNTISRMVNELSILVDSLTNPKVLSKTIGIPIEISSVYLIGQSLGGAVSIIYANKSQIPKKLILLGSVGTLFRYTKRQIQEWKAKGYIEFSVQRTGQKLRLNYSYYDDIENNNYSLEKLLASLDIPILIIHGQEDLTVPLKEIKSMITNSNNSNVHLEVIPKANHTFGFETNPTPENTTLNRIAEIINEFLK